MPSVEIIQRFRPLLNKWPTSFGIAGGLAPDYAPLPQIPRFWNLGEAGRGSIPFHNRNLFLRQPIQLIDQLINPPPPRGRIRLQIGALRRQAAIR